MRLIDLRNTCVRTCTKPGLWLKETSAFGPNMHILVPVQQNLSTEAHQIYNYQMYYEQIHRIIAALAQIRFNAWVPFTLDDSLHTRLVQDRPVDVLPLQ